MLQVLTLFYFLESEPICLMNKCIFFKYSCFLINSYTCFNILQQILLVVLLSLMVGLKNLRLELILPLQLLLLGRSNLLGGLLALVYQSGWSWQMQDILYLELRLSLF